MDKDLKAYQKEMRRQFDPAYLKTVMMPDLYNSVFESQHGLIEGLLPRGTYLFVGSPKVGKSFMMAQIAYHISTETRKYERLHQCSDGGFRKNYPPTAV